MNDHQCQQPLMAVAGKRPQQPDWTCGVCGRIWRDTPSGAGGFHWVEVSGPDPALTARGRSGRVAPIGEGAEHYGARFFGEREARVYDDLTADMFEPAVVTPAVEMLADLADGGAVLEMGIGTGRVALPLAARGVHVRGIDVSEAMVAQLRAKPGGNDIPVTIGDFATARVEGEFTLVYLVFNTIFNLVTQDEQVACFENAAAHLRTGGRFVVELFVPDLHRIQPGENACLVGVDARRISYDVYDVVTQRLTSHHLVFGDERVSSFPVEGRYAWPAELDLMARLAGLRLLHRWGGWSGEAFTSLSRSHVSVYQRY